MDLIRKSIKQGFCYDDVLLIPQRSSVNSRADIDLSVDLGKEVKLDIPVISANMKNVTGPTMAKAIASMGGLGLLHRFCSVDEQIDMFKESSGNYNTVGCSIGVHDNDFERAKKLIDVGCNIICIDVAHGHSEICLNMTEKLADYIQKDFPDVLLIAGNVATAFGANDLYQAGADVVKCGIGSGSLCSTRLEAGAGCPQLTALENCFNASRPTIQYDTTVHINSTEIPANEQEIKMGTFEGWDLLAPRRFKIIADGGIRRAGDCVKALVFADAVMLGNVLAGTDEAPGNIVTINGMKYKEYEGSSTHKSKHIEGVKGLVGLKGPVSLVVEKLLEGIRSGCSYQGAENLEELKECAEFIQISNAGLKESHPHDIYLK